MKAIVQDRYGSADVLAHRDIAAPVVGDNDVLVRVHAAGCGPDVWHLIRWTLRGTLASVDDASAPCGEANPQNRGTRQRGRRRVR